MSLKGLDMQVSPVFSNGQQLGGSVPRRLTDPSFITSETWTSTSSGKLEKPYRASLRRVPEENRERETIQESVFASPNFFFLRNNHTQIHSQIYFILQP